MNMTEKNGQPSMEEILASIRRIIAEEPTSHSRDGELRGTPIMLKGDGALDDASEFDLPAIFRSSPPPAAERQAPLLGRLTDAIRSATTVQPEPREIAASEAYQPAQLADASASAASGLSSLKPVRSDLSTEPAGSFGGSSPGETSHPQISPASSSASAFPVTTSGSMSDEEPKRVMAPFKDTHFMRMAPGQASTSAPASAPSPSSPPAAAAPYPVAAPQEEAKSTDFGTIIPGQFDRPSLTMPHAPQQAAPIAMPPPPLPTAEPVQHAFVPTPPVAGAGESGGIEDATADLLRPMLRQWLADNMPRMVEKALHIEIAESLKAPKKP
jgi:cell pole-organizing protein PopZ